MSKIILFNQTDNLYGHLNQIFSEDFKVTVITPSPSIADATRQGLANENSFDVITISKFLKDNLLELIGPEIESKFKGKSELILLLSSLWKKLNLELDYDLFVRCFNLLTDFRSFTLSQDILETVLENYNETIRLGVLRMHQVMMQLDYFDEHRSYFELSERYREGNLPIEKQGSRNILFYGFDFLSGSQVDLINSLGIRDQIYIPLRQSVFEKKNLNDWISWLRYEEDDCLIIDEKPNPKSVRFIEYPKNYLPALLKQLNQKRESDILLGSKRASLEQILEVNIHGSLFKVQSNIFDEELEIFIQKLLKLEKTKDLSSFIAIEIKESLAAENFRQFKVIKQFEETLNHWRDISDSNVELTFFDIKNFKEILSLDLPRVSMINTQKDPFEDAILTLAQIDNLNPDRNLILTLASEYGSVRSSVVRYNSQVETYLASIGPIRRAQFEFEVLKDKMLNLPQKEIIIVSEFGLLEKDYYWKEIISGFSLSEENCPPFDDTAGYYGQIEVQNKEIDHYSATMLQTYYDCPRKYFFQYIEKVMPRLNLETQVDLLQKGRLEHLLIEKYVSRFDSFSLDDFSKMKLQMIEEETNSEVLLAINRAQFDVEIDALTIPIIKKLLKIKAMPETIIEFEKTLEENNIRGSIDCFIKTPHSIFVLDFKRGAGSLPSQKEFLEFSKLQLWFYANHVESSLPLNLGYINLSENENSLVFLSIKDSEQSIMNILESKPLSFKDDFEDKLKQYKAHEQRIIDTVHADSLFDAKPRKSNACLFCHFSRTCSKGVFL